MRVQTIHWICCRCGQVKHMKLGSGPDDCPVCGCSSWYEPTVNYLSKTPVIDQLLPDSCPMCRAAKASARNADAAKTQLGMFAAEVQ
jgi:rubrerythrin